MYPPTQVGDAAGGGGWPASAVLAAVVIVGVEPVGRPGDAFCLGMVRTGVGPFVSTVQLNRSTLPLARGVWGRVRLWVIGSPRVRACLSYRVAIPRQCFSRRNPRSTVLRWAYVFGSKVGGRPPADPFALRRSF